MDRALMYPDSLERFAKRLPNLKVFDHSSVDLFAAR